MTEKRIFAGVLSLVLVLFLFFGFIPATEADALSTAFFVSGAENAQTSQILSDIESFTAGRQNMVCRCGDEEIAREARAQGLSCGRYAAYLEWKALDPFEYPG